MPEGALPVAINTAHGIKTKERLFCYHDAMMATESFKLLNRAILYLESNLTEPASVAEAAALVGYSRYHFSRTFLERIGITPAAYLRKRRLTEAARELATTSKRILDIALDYQFQSQEAFTRSFKREFGVSPGFYRIRGRLRRLFDKITLGATRLLYPGHGIGITGRFFVPEQAMVAALITPYPYPERTTKPILGVAVVAMDNMKIRLAQRQDIPDLCRLYHVLHELTARGVPERLQSLGEFECYDATWLSLTLEKLIDAAAVVIWVAEVNGQVVGLAEVYLREDKDDPAVVAYRYGYLQSLVVDPPLRGRGIGRRLVAAAEAWCKGEGAGELRLESWEFAQGPLGFYTQQGYRTLRRTLVRKL
jgi:AraC-like DNA-binding protein/GNAT superfamily N-acetyltransferase